MRPRVVVYGAGGHGKVVADILLRTSRCELLGFVDDGREAGTRVFELPVLGGRQWLRDLADAKADAAGEQERPSVALGIGDNGARERTFAFCRELGLEVITAVHPTAAVAPSTRLGEGTVVMANASVNPGAVLGPGAIVNTGAVVEHDCRVGAFAHLSPNATMGGGATLGEGTHLGLGAVVLPGVSVGDRTVIGAGAVVNRNIDGGVVAHGVPARVTRRID